MANDHLELLSRVARTLRDPEGRGSGVDHAQALGWLDGDKAVTPDGEDVLNALDEQAHTRTVFRTF